MDNRTHAADARFLGGIGLVLAAATLITGLVLISSVPKGQNTVPAETSQPVVVATVDNQPVFYSPHDLPQLVWPLRTFSAARTQTADRH